MTLRPKYFSNLGRVLKVTTDVEVGAVGKDG